MAIKTNYNYKGISIEDAYIRIDRLWGSSKEGWTALVGVYNITTEEVPAIEAVEAVEAVLDEEGNVITQAIEAVEGVEATTKTVYNKLEEFNRTASYNAEERGYVSLYNALKAEFGGTDC